VLGARIIDNYNETDLEAHVFYNGEYLAPHPEAGNHHSDKRSR
jgi:hypothetical protein